MRRKCIAIGTVVLVALALLVAVAGPAGANPATLTPELLAEYDVTITQLAEISAGNFPNGNWEPFAPVTRGECALMIVRACGIELANPKIPTFPDVDRSNPLYKYIEGGAAVGAWVGYEDGLFRPANPVGHILLYHVMNEILGYELDPDYTYHTVPPDELTRIQVASEILHAY